MFIKYGDKNGILVHKLENVVTKVHINNKMNPFTCCLNIIVNCALHFVLKGGFRLVNIRNSFKLWNILYFSKIQYFRLVFRRIAVAKYLNVFLVFLIQLSEFFWQFCYQPYLVSQSWILHYYQMAVKTPPSIKNYLLLTLVNFIEYLMISEIVHQSIAQKL